MPAFLKIDVETRRAWKKRIKSRYPAKFHRRIFWLIFASILIIGAIANWGFPAQVPNLIS